MCPPEYIISELQKLYLPSKDLVERGIEVSKNPKDIDSLIKLIEDVVKLNVKLIKIHPFSDGNGKTVRAFYKSFI